MATTYNIFDIQVYDALTKRAIISTGGKLYVAATGAYAKATLVDPDNDYAALANPITATRGKFRFAIANTGLGSPALDIFGMAPTGQAFRALNIKPGEVTDIYIDTTNVVQQLIVPFSIADTTANTETDTGFDFPVGATILPFPSIDVRTVDSGMTIDVGLLASESGDADGFLDGISLTTAGQIKPTFASAVTQGALLRVTATGAAAVIPEPGIISTAVSLSYTLSSSTDTGAGYIKIPYALR
jgi:hypothetical protein